MSKYRFARLSTIIVVSMLSFMTPGIDTAAFAQAPQPAGMSPSAPAKQICQREVVTDIDQDLGLTAQVTKPTWSNHLYACEYHYPTGTIRLSVKELSSSLQTSTYFNGLAKALHKSITLHGLKNNEGAFAVTAGSVVVRKDWKVLLVDTSHLPNAFGTQKSSREQVALLVAGLIMGCWTGN